MSSMEKENITIRLEKEEEYREVENLVRESFWNVYRPGCMEHFVLHQLRNDPAFVPELDFVMIMNNKLIGQNMFMREEITSDDGRSIPVMTMGPICIMPELKKHGYGKSGFKEASDFGIGYHGLKEGEDAPFFLCRELIPGYFNGVTGVYAAPEGYMVDEKEVEAFDKKFPYKEKKKLPGQIF